MSKSFDISLFLLGVLSGSKATQHRHLRQAKIMQAAIEERWGRDNPWTWQLKHVKWFFDQHLQSHSDATRYYYRLTASLLLKRMAIINNPRWAGAIAEKHRLKPLCPGVDTPKVK
ncbi:hypothetical protein [Pseudomonas monteilii]|uniref:hypothetical protein n=1 Tax=Pseudomonas monteilii TaxID=76759 RepID=UPI00383B9B35